MGTRLELHEQLCKILDTRYAYFQPPETVKMKYPAIVYELDDIRNEFADDGVYLFRKRYLITLIDKNPDSLFVDKLALFPISEFVRHYTADNLHHWVFRIFY